LPITVTVHISGKVVVSLNRPLIKLLFPTCWEEMHSNCPQS